MLPTGLRKLIQLGSELIDVPSKVSTRGLGGRGDETGRGPPGKGGAGHSALLGGFACTDQGSASLFGHDRECDIRTLATA